MSYKLSAGRAKVCFRQLKKRRERVLLYYYLRKFCRLKKLCKLFLIFDTIFSPLNYVLQFFKKIPH